MGVPHSKPGHDYLVTRGLQCSAAGGFEALKDSGGGPMAGPIPDSSVSRSPFILFDQQITQTIDSGTRTVTNVTTPTNFFRHGSVTLLVTTTGARSSRLTIGGVGTNVSNLRALLYQYAGIGLFMEVALDVQRKCRIEN